MREPVQQYIIPASVAADARAELPHKVQLLYKQKDKLALDFDDLVFFTAYILHNFQNVREKWQERMNYVMIDEAQDCNAMDWDIVETLAAGSGNLFAVGDPDQTIYEWRGAKPDMFVAFKADSDIVLDENYRSTQGILDVANSIIVNNRNRPVCVLSSNDGNIVALTPEAKALGVRRGDPYFKVRDVLERNRAAVFSGNLVLYAAMSERVQSIMRQTVVRTESYSIDEQFLYLDGYGTGEELADMMRGMVERIRLWTDIPVSVGIAQTKTLAKVASRFAKSYPGYRSVCLIDSDRKRRKALSMSGLSDMWGIWRRTIDRLARLGVATPLEFAERRTITTSRSFGTMVTGLDDLRASVASFAASCAATLRAQGFSASEVTVFIMSNRFREDLPQYFNSGTVRLPLPTSDTLELTKAATGLAERLYRPGIQYKKSGVTLSSIAGGLVHHSLFDTGDDRERKAGLSRRMDALNRRFGLKTVRLATDRPQLHISGRHLPEPFSAQRNYLAVSYIPYHPTGTTRASQKIFVKFITQKT